MTLGSILDLCYFSCELSFVHFCSFRSPLHGLETSIDLVGFANRPFRDLQDSVTIEMPLTLFIYCEANFSAKKCGAFRRQEIEQPYNVVQNYGEQQIDQKGPRLKLCLIKLMVFVSSETGLAM